MSSKNQITIPAEVRKLLQLKPGETIVFDVEQNGPEPAVSIRRSPTLEDLAGSVPVPDDVRALSWDEIRARAWTGQSESDAEPRT